MVPPAPAEPVEIDSKLLAFIREHAGRVTVRQLTRSLATCRTAAAAESRLASLVRAGFGIWSYPPPGPKGGRPTRKFVLLIPPRSISTVQASAVRGSPQIRWIVRALVQSLDRYERIEAQVLAEAMAEVLRIVKNAATSEFECLMPFGGRRSFRITARGVRTRWVYRSPN